MAAKKSGARQELSIDGHRVAVTNLDKVFYPEAGFTKGQIIDYYIRVSKYLLPHFINRPVTLKRYPDGIGGEFFYEKDAPGYTPEWVETFPVPRRSGESDIRYILVNNLATLVWCANIATIEFHPFLHRAPAIEQPAEVVFDLDPGEGSSVLACAEVAFILRELLDAMGLKSYAKVSGSKGIQVYAPLNTPAAYSETQAFARTVAQLLERQHQTLIVSEMAKIARKNKVFIDWSQNADYKTTVGVYSLRAKRQHPFVSAPVSWEELDKALSEKDSSMLYFEPGAALERFETKGDLFAPVLELKQKLPANFTAAVPSRETRPAAKSLAAYNRKRDFSRTSEPKAGPAKASRQGGKRRFVVQKHAASHLHYDFRLEMHGTLKSWAVPKGVPFAAGEKRLAMATEDHPIEYLNFEGTIPEGQYGGGTVMVWDTGTYEIIEGNYYKGILRLFLEGKKLKGEWLLQRDEKGGDRNWQLTRTGPDLKRRAGTKEETSVLSGRTLDEIAAAKDAEWQSNRAAPPAKLDFIEPMKAALVSHLPEGPGWSYEIKLDGYRAEAVRYADRVALLSRRNNDLNTRFPEIARSCEALEPGTIVDGEVVALDEHGHPSFNLLQNHQTTRQPVVYYVFDLLVHRGRSLLGRPLRERRELLAGALAHTADPVRLLGTLEAPVRELVAAARKQDMEGLVAKRSSSIYQPGQRSGAWVKFKINKGQELVIGGYKPGKQGFESLLAGYYEGDRLMFVGKLKNGFVPQTRREVAAHFPALETDVPPFANLPERKNARRGEALTAEAMKNYRWLKPELVAQVEFTDWTEANHLRHSRFAGLREDKDPRDVVHEVAAKP